LNLTPKHQLINKGCSYLYPSFNFAEEIRSSCPELTSALLFIFYMNLMKYQMALTSLV